MISAYNTALSALQSFGTKLQSNSTILQMPTQMALKEPG